jgi:hypothetical protein
MSRYRNLHVKIRPEAIPEYWLARQREMAEMEEGGERPTGGDLTEEEAREEARRLLSVGGPEGEEAGS